MTKIVTWDIETAPALADVWSLFNTNVSLSQLRKPQRVICLAWKWYGDRRVNFDSEWNPHEEDPHTAMIYRIWNVLDNADAVVSYNGKAFDSKHINWEFARLGLGRPSPYREIDLRAVVKKHFKPTSGKLDFVAQELLGQRKTSHDGHDMWVKVLGGDPAARKHMEKYNRQDVNVTEKLYEFLRDGGWLDAHAHFVCDHKRTQKRGKVLGAGGQVYQQIQCTDCRGWFRSSVNEAGGLNPLRRIA